MAIAVYHLTATLEIGGCQPYCCTWNTALKIKITDKPYSAHPDTYQKHAQKHYHKL